MTSAVLWPYLVGTANVRFWVVCHVKPNTTIAIVDSYSSVTQEDYVQLPEQEEGRLCLFTTSGGAQRHMRALVVGGNYGVGEMKVCRIQMADLEGVIKQIDNAYFSAKGRHLRVDVNDLKKDGSFSREILYSHWIPKH